MGGFGEPVTDPQAAWNAALLQAGGERMRTLYIHIPFCRARCSFCPFYFGKAAPGQMEAYVEALDRELTWAADQDGLGMLPVNAVYFGGGTPTDMEPEHFALLLSQLRRSYNLTNDCEITIEGRVTGFSRDKIKACVDNGVNRFSIGVQTFNTELRRSFGRIAARREVMALLKQLHATNQAAVSVDLLYGLPGQTLEDWLADQLIATDLVPLDGICHYRLGIMGALPLGKAIAAGKMPPLPDEDCCFEMYQAGEGYLLNCGAARLSIKHYGLTCRERNASNEISGHKNPCLPFGIRAGGRVGNSFFISLKLLSSTWHWLRLAKNR